MLKGVELFAGAGGLALGVGLAGFESLALVELDQWACDTLRENQERGYPLVSHWNIKQCDVRKFQWEGVGNGVDLIAGGPPCQPFSMGGKHRAHDDNRDMFPTTVEVVRTLQPRAFIIENVKGLTRSTFANYYQHILLQLAFPELVRQKNETWFSHFMRLQQEQASGAAHGKGLTYNVVPTLVNAADFGVPQRRERVFIVGFRADLGIDWSFPVATHSQDALLHDKWITGEYWDRHRVASRSRPTLSAAALPRISRLRSEPHSGLLPWRTVRDALIGLPDPHSREAANVPNHKLQLGARAYPGHTGSPLDLPAKTLKAGDHGVPGGENMLALPNGTFRYFTVRESARLQTFPDGFHFHGSWTETMRQLGNAVPVILARAVASSVAERLLAADARVLMGRRNRAKGAA